MLGEGLFGGEGRPSPPSPCYMDNHRNGTPSKLTRANLNPTQTEDVRRIDFFDDPVTLVRELSTAALGVPEFFKFEKNVYRSRYLNTPECFALLNNHYNNLMTRYAPKLQTLLSQYRADLTLSTLNQMALFSSDHLKSLAVLAVLGNYHNLNLEGLNTYLMNTMRLLYRTVTAGKVDPVDKSRMFYAFLTKSENMGRVAVLYMLLLAVLEKLLWFAETEETEDEMHAVFSFMICCFVEEMLSTEVPDHAPQKTGMLPPMATKMDMLVRHLSVVAFLLKLKVALPNASVLLSCVLALRNKLRGRNRSLLVWTWILSVYLDPEEVANGGFKAPRAFFEDVGVNSNLAQFTHVVTALKHCFKDLKFCKFVEDNLSITKFVSLFLFNIWKYVNSLKDDLANEILLLANSMLDTFPKTPTALAKFLTQFPYHEKGEVAGINATRDTDSKFSVGVQKSMEALFNIALLGKSRLQMSACLFVAKLLLSADVTVTLPRVNKVSYTNSMLTDLGLTNPTAYLASHPKEYTPNSLAGEFGEGGPRPNDPTHDDNLVKDLAKMTLLGALMKYCWKDVLSCLLAKLGPYTFEYQKPHDKYNHDKYFKLDQFDKFRTDPMERNAKNKEDKQHDRDLLNVLNYVRAAHIGSSSKETLYAMLSAGNLPAKMLSYETLAGLTPKPETLVMCAMMGMYGRYQTFATLFSNFLALRGGLAYSNAALCNRNWTNYMVLLLDTLLTHYLESCDVTRQKLVNSLLAGGRNNADLDRDKYQQMARTVREHKAELQRLRGDHEQLVSELSAKREEYEYSLAKLKGELSATAERHKSELHKMKEMVNKATANAQQLEQAVNAAKAENATLKQENARVASERDDLRAETNAAKNKAAQQQRELERLAGLTRDYEAKAAKLKRLQGENDRMSEELAQHNANLENVYRMLICLTDKYKSNMETLENQKETLRNLSHQAAQHKATAEKLNSDLREKKLELADLGKYKSINEAEIARMGKELIKREEALANANKRIAEFRDSVENLNHSLQKKTDAYLALKHQYAEMERELAQRRQQLTAIESAFNARPL